VGIVIRVECSHGAFFVCERIPHFGMKGAYPWRKCTFGFLHGCITKSSCLCLKSCSFRDVKFHAFVMSLHRGPVASTRLARVYSTCVLVSLLYNSLLRNQCTALDGHKMWNASELRPLGKRIYVTHSERDLNFGAGKHHPNIVAQP
jgi:hypothetical protein